MNQFLGKAGSKILLMGNEAIARGAIEGGVQFVSGYPGTPSSEVIMTLSEVSNKIGIFVEWFANEKVALEAAFSASSAGLRSMVTMKAPGVNVASDALLSVAYAGVNGGMIILVADDPGPHTTQTEQDSRFYSLLANLPMLEPSDPQEAKDMVVWGLDFSEEYHLPVILRTTTRVNHTSSDVVLGEIKRFDRKPKFPREPKRYIRASMRWNLDRHIWLNKRMELISSAAAKCPFNLMDLKGDNGVITCGVSYVYVLEALRRLNINSCSILKLGLTNPLSIDLLNKFLSHCKKVIFIEELEPFLEERIRALSTTFNLNVVFHGKLNGLLPREGEFNIGTVESALAKFLELNSGISKSDIVSLEAPPRGPVMCAGCPHRSTYYALLRTIRESNYKREDVPIFGDIGCYALSLQKPLEAIWTEHCMGASISMALGLKISGYDKPVIATIGDSTLLHSGIPALLDAYHFDVNISVVILDNSITAMTGHQPHPGVDFRADGSPAKKVDIVNLVKGIGIEKIEVIDPYDIRRSIEAFKRALSNTDGVYVIVARRECAILARRMGKRYHSISINYDVCRKCKVCVNTFGCPAIYWDPFKGPLISQSHCNGCGSCSFVCPFKAIEVY
ncbi:MAG: indolepyruvate ferredoxin oxidoreductase subunit alpha [Candidatus Methanomethylicia archaeon]|nr:indolepyruvate ferredoxin oxidoreductase subunit alpha [Candidatus Methanomethylicia archaeon]MCX8168933.1 indolepyruvate ferredoxin oxidoreductase subunit alpha [Candidatus Methanomethylicia archaeon]MDW7988665.1 indolepyruvate ferredoxin oxidoreductase subunit alpha [Nitrososphaerota archaeon]